MPHNMKQIDTCGLSFADLREEGMYYVDKTLLLADILGNNLRGVYLYTRPRRFGKTTNLSMLDAFFNIQYKGNTWFDGLKISEYPEYAQYKNAFPVIRLDLKDTVASNNKTFMNRVRSAIAEAYHDHMYLLDSELDETDAILFRKVLSKETSDDYVPDCIRDLCRLLNKYHGRRAIILIDEYDRAVADSFGDAAHRKSMDSLGTILSSALKSNPHLQLAYITGIMQIAKENIFSGLNNLRVNNILSRESDERFGFTESEVKELLSYYGRSDEFDVVKTWYDGYRFGDAEVYNPYSIMYYTSSPDEPLPYWANTAKDVAIEWLLDKVDMKTFSNIMSLVNGGSIDIKLNVTQTYEDLKRDIKSVYNLMVLSGYLKAIPKGDGSYEVSIPNKEVMTIVNEKMWNLNLIDDGTYNEFNIAVLDGDSEKAVRILQSVLKDASYLTLNDEHDYQLVMMTIMHTLSRAYSIRTEYEAGNGRLDMILTPRREGMTPLIFELKKVDSERELDGAVENAIAQIHERRYYLDMSGEVILFGIAFWSKIPKGRSERILVRNGTLV